MAGKTLEKLILDTVLGWNKLKKCKEE